jgi:UDP-N-acetylmuramyl pentapeptide phosphotransferase/UDP-N-acetylglucosamine-1-phosphate transferase
MGVVLAWVVGFLAVRFLLIAGRELLQADALRRVNHRGHVVFTASGVAVAMAVLIVEAGRSGLGAIGLGDEPGLNLARQPVLFAALGFAFLGFLDDVLGGEDRGFRGHIRALAHGRLTSGMVKLLGGAAIALVLASVPGFVTWQRLVADAVLIALAANLANLLDRAPGRTLKYSLLAYVPLAIVAGAGSVAVAVAPVMGAAVGVLPEDLREHSMLGDTGANVLGGVLGLMVVLVCGRGVRNGVLVGLIVLNLTSELVSFSRVIAAVPPLRWFDSLGRVRPGDTAT